MTLKFGFKPKFKLGDEVEYKGYIMTITGYFIGGYITNMHDDSGYKIDKSYLEQYNLTGMMKVGDRERDIGKNSTNAKIIKSLRDF